MSFIKKNWPILILIAVGFFVFAFNLHNRLFWDDNDWIINNNFVHSISWNNVEFWFTHNTLAGVGLKSNYYRPLLFFTYAINYVIDGTRPFFWHLISNSIHIANGVLIFSILYLVSRKKLVAFITALIFLIHPLQTEAVTYIAGRGDPLYVFFILLALWLIVKAEIAQPLSSSTRRRVWIVGSLLSLILALLSREVAIIFPLLALVFYVSFISPSTEALTELSRTSLRPQDKFIKSIKLGIIRTWSYFTIVAVYGVLRLTVLNFQNTLNFYAAPNQYSENLFYRLLTFMHVLVDYFRLLFVPTGLHMERSMTVHTSLLQWPVWFGTLIVALIVIAGVILYRKENYKNGGNSKRFGFGISDFRMWAFGWGWFFIALAPVSGVTPINAVIYEHWLYLPMIGFWFIVSFYLVELLDYFKKTRKPLFILCALLVVAYASFFGLQSVKRNILWGNPAEFYKDILKYEPESVRINNNLGNLYYDKGDLIGAEEFYRKAAEAGDVFPQPHFNLGSILQSQGDTFGAIKEFEKAIELDPSFYYPYQNLAVIYAQQGDFLKAAKNIEKLKLLISNNPRVYYNSALVYLALNDKKKALEDLQVGLKYSISDPQTGKLIKELIRRLQK